MGGVGLIDKKMKKNQGKIGDFAALAGLKRASDSVIREFKSLYPSQTKEQASACSFCFTCEAVKERFELRATPPGEKTVLRTVFSDDRRYLQSIGLNFRICFANNKRKISLPIIFFYSLFLFAEDLRYFAGVTPYFFLKAFIK